MIDKKSPVHLYLQVADDLRRRIETGEYTAGSLLPTELQLCALYGISRFPMRQAMSILVEQGYLVRSRGRGTFVNAVERRVRVQNRQVAGHCRTLALFIAGECNDFSKDILSGFERGASERGYMMSLCFTHSPQMEMEALRRSVRCGVSGIVAFPINGTLITEETLNEFVDDGVYVSFIDRNHGLDRIDYVGSDNNGGGYVAARHMKQQGYGSAVFVSEALQSGVSSVAERYAGFRRGLAQYNMRLLNEEAPGYDGDCSLERFRAALPFYLQQQPFAVFAENFSTGKDAMQTLQDAGVTVGADVGLISFDNPPESRYLNPPMTTIAQNGVLIGETAAALAITKIESGSSQSVRHILPTQLIIRRSCGEDRSKD